LPRNRKPDPKQSQFTEEQIAALKAHALKLWKADTSHALELGLALLAVRAALPHGAFKPWWKQNNLSQARVSYCMRLAEGKVAAAKAKQRTLERTVMKQLKKNVDGCLKFCVDPKRAPSLDQIEASLRQLYLHMIGGVGRIRHWPRINEQDAKVQAATQNFKQALSELLDAAFNPVTFDDLERIHPDRVQPHLT